MFGCCLLTRKKQLFDERQDNKFTIEALQQRTSFAQI